MYGSGAGIPTSTDTTATAALAVEAHGKIVMTVIARWSLNTVTPTTASAITKASALCVMLNNEF